MTIDERIKKLQAMKDRQVKIAEARKQIEAGKKALASLRKPKS
jgi:hypothetical protein